MKKNEKADIVDTETGEVFDEVQAVVEIAKLDEQAKEIAAKKSDLKAGLLKFMDGLGAKKRSIGEKEVPHCRIQPPPGAGCAW